MIKQTRRSKQEVVELFLHRQKNDKYYHPKHFIKEFNYKNTSTVYSILKEFQIEFLPFDKNRDTHQSFSLDVLNGNMLGDGFIYFSSLKHHNPVFCVEYKHKEYCKYINSVNPFLTGQSIKYRKRYSDRYEHGYVECFKSTSLSSTVLKELHSKWYVNGIKTVPKDLELTPQSLLIWFLDDGYTSTTGGLYLATDGFSLEDNEFLQQQLSLLSVNVNFHIASSKKNVRLYIPKSYVETFYQLIGPCPVNCYRYKWM
jgi:hypothetical protein